MTETVLSDLAEGDIDRLLREAEARLAAKENGHGERSVTALPTAELVKRNENDKTLAATNAVNTNTEKPISEDLSVRIAKPRLSKKEFKQQTKITAGPAWFDLPKTDLTPELARDLKLLKSRNVLDKSRFYKKDSSKASVPEFSQVGTVVEGPTEYFTARMTKKERKRTLLDEVMATEASNRKFKSKYGEIQTAKMSGKKAHYKKMMAKRYGKK